MKNKTTKLAQNTLPCVLDELYLTVARLSDQNGAKVLRLRHRTLGRDLILRQYQTPVPAYDLLVGVRHKNLPTVYESRHFPEGQLVFEEAIDGITAAEVLETGLYTPRGAVRLLREVCCGVAALHRLGILHRDLKPENVLITPTGAVKLIDLNASELTAPGVEQATAVLGTIGYAAYEQLGISQCDERTDIFALGVLLNVLLTGDHPAKRLASGRLGKIVLKCTQIDPASRYQTVEALLEAL